MRSIFTWTIRKIVESEESEEVQPGIILDFNEEEQVVGVEILNAGRRVPESSLEQMHFAVAS